MSDKLEALSQPVAIHPEVKEFILDGIGDATTHDCITDCDYKFAANLEKLLQPLYSQEYVTALLAALEEKDQSIAELNVKLFDQSILLDAAISRAEAAGRREEHLKADVAVMGNRIAELETGHSEAAKQISSWRNLAKQNIAEREKDIAAIESARQRNADLEQRLQQPIKLRSRVFEMMNVGGGHSIQVVSVNTVKEIIRAAGFKVEVEGE